MVIFPLSWPGKIVLILIAIALGLIYWMLAKPEHWTWMRKKKDDAQEKK
jgi:chromate transport protein ChrA